MWKNLLCKLIALSNLKVIKCHLREGKPRKKSRLFYTNPAIDLKRNGSWAQDHYGLIFFPGARGGIFKLGGYPKRFVKLEIHLGFNDWMSGW